MDGIKPFVLVSGAMFKLMSENMRKLQAHKEHAGKKTAEEMPGNGTDLPDLPQPAPAILKLETAAPPSSVPISEMLPTGSNGQK